jgi:hypothetical protein
VDLRLLKLLQENIRAEKGQLIIAPHNPLMIGSLYRKQVRILAREDNRIVSSEPEYDPIGIGVEGCLSPSFTDCGRRWLRRCSRY